jgi:hypothetical protein
MPPLAGRDIVFHVVPNPVPGWCQHRVLPVMTAPAETDAQYVDAALLDSAGHDAPALDAALPAKDSRPG